MKSLLILACATILLALPPVAWANNVGFTRIAVPDGANPPIEVGVWYPADGTPMPTPIGPFVQKVVRDGPAKGNRLPLVVISHGTGGGFTGHSDTAYALAASGFVAAAPTHTGDNARDQSRVLDIMDRPRQLWTVIDFMVSHWRPGTIDVSRIGAFGFSAGGFTVLAAAGGTPDLRLIGPHCDAHPAYFDCQLIKSHLIKRNRQSTGGITDPAALKRSADAHIRALVVAAPALGFTFTKKGLATVTMPVQLWRANDDAVLPYPEYADAVKTALPNNPEMHLVPNAGHLDFLAPCSAALAHAVPAICVSRPDFDRAAFHQKFNRVVTVFFRHTLGD
jgi:predicted dienelactone hydrolase